MDHNAEDDRAYFLRRSEQHRSAALRSGDAGTRERHERFAAAYADRAATLVDQD